MTLAAPPPNRSAAAPLVPASQRAMHNLFRDALAGRIEVVPLDVHKYHAIIDAGWEDKTVELLDGIMVRKIRGTKEDPLSIGDRHTFAVDAVQDLNAHVKPRGGYVRTQQPVVVWDASEPEPDNSIARGTFRSYVGRKPAAADVSCVVEVADASLRFDRTRKLETYARSAVPQYVILNLVDDRIEVHEDPDPAAATYRRRAVAGRGDTIQLLMPDGGKLDVAVNDLLPPPTP